MQVYNEFSALYSKEPIAIHYRRIQILYCPVAKDKEEFWSESLFSDSDLPCRIIVCFVSSKSKNGSYHTNPFEFRRNWLVPSNLISSESQSSMLHHHQLLEQNLEDKFNSRFEALNQSINEKIDLVMYKTLIFAFTELSCESRLSCESIDCRRSKINVLF
jgi:hypothetical protein